MSAFERALLPFANLHYNPLVPQPRSLATCRVIGVFLALAGVCFAQQAPPSSAARVLVMPRKLISGERATLAVLDGNGRLTPGVDVQFSDEEKVTTDVTGRALFVAPLNPGVFTAQIAGRGGRTSSSVLPSPGLPVSLEQVTGAPRVASLSDRFELEGEGFCGDADANRVSIAGRDALILASSPTSLEVLPPADLEPGVAQVAVACGPKHAKRFAIIFVALELQAKEGSLAPGEHRELVVRVRGTTTKVMLEAHNLAREVADLTGGVTVRASSSGEVENVAKFEVVGKKRGNFAISIRLLTTLSALR
jgi:hypothetical protein